MIKLHARLRRSQVLQTGKRMYNHILISYVCPHKHRTPNSTNKYNPIVMGNSFVWQTISNSLVHQSTNAQTLASECKAFELHQIQAHRLNSFLTQPSQRPINGFTHDQNCVCYYFEHRISISNWRVVTYYTQSHSLVYEWYTFWHRWHYSLHIFCGFICSTLRKFIPTLTSKAQLHRYCRLGYNNTTKFTHWDIKTFVDQWVNTKYSQH